MGKRSSATRTIPAHVDLRTIRIQETHPEVSLVRALNQDNSFTPNTDTATSQGSHDKVIFPRDLAITVVNEYKIIARTMHFGKFDFHTATP
jgi:hypothetical protein